MCWRWTLAQVPDNLSLVLSSVVLFLLLLVVVSVVVLLVEAAAAAAKIVRNANTGRQTDRQEVDTRAEGRTEGKTHRQAIRQAGRHIDTQTRCHASTRVYSHRHNLHMDALRDLRKGTGSFGSFEVCICSPKNASGRVRASKIGV